METLTFLCKVILLRILFILSNSEQTLAEGLSFTFCPIDRTISINVGETMTNVNWATPQVVGGQGDVTVTPSRAPGTSFGLGDKRVTYRAVDEAGNNATCAFIVTVKAPTIYGCPDRTIYQDNEPDQDYADVTWVEPLIADESTTSSLTSDIRSGDRFYIGETTVTYTLTDDGPNVETCAFIVEVLDVEPPIFNTCPGDINTRVLAEAACNVTLNWIIPTATDNDMFPSVTNSHLPGSSLFDCGVTEVHITATDESGNVGYCKFNVTVEVGAYENCPENITGATLPGLFRGTVTWTPPTILDRQPSWEEIASREVGDSFMVGTTNVTYTLLDPSGAADVCWFLVTIIDVEPPVIICPEDIVVTATSTDGGAIVRSWPEPFTSDNVFVQQIWSSHKPGNEFPVGDTVVVYGVNDTNGHTSFCNFTITVRDFVVSLFTQIDGYTFVDNDDIIVRTSDVVECLKACVSENAFICRSAEYTSSGECRLSETVARTESELQPQDNVIYFEKVGDNTPPTISSCPNDVTRRAIDGHSFTAIAWLEPLANDDSGGPVTWTSTHQPGDVFSLGVTEVVYMVTDDSFNRATCSFTVTIIDDQEPVIEDCPGHTFGYLHSADERSVEVSWAVPAARDNSDMVTLMGSHQPGTMFERGDTVVRYTAVDPSGNGETCQFTVSVVFLADQNRFTLRVLLPNLVYSDSLADKNSEHYQMIDETLQIKVQEAFAMDSTFLDSRIIDISMSETGGVEIKISLGFSEETTPDSKRREIEILLNSLKTDGLVGAGVEEVQVVNDDGTAVTVDVCYLLPCPAGMNCTIQGDTCVSYCSDNPDYCLHDGFCVKPNGDQLVSCLCSAYIYHGTRCELEDTINEPRTLAIVVGAFWGVILLLLLVLCFPLCVRRCQQSKTEHHGSNSELVKADTFYGSESDSDNDEGNKIQDKSTYPEKKKIISPDPQQNGAKINPAYIHDEQEFKGNGKEMLHTGDGSNRFILDADSRSRSQGDGKSNLSDEMNETISMSVMSDSQDPTLTIENEVMTSTLVDFNESEPNGRIVSTADAPSALTEMDSYGDVPDVRFADPWNGSSDDKEVTAVVHSSGDGNFTVRSSLGAIEEEEENVFQVDCETSSTNERGSIADSIDGIY